MRLKNREEGRFWLESALQRDPDAVLVHEELANYYESIGDAARVRFHRRRIDEIKNSTKKP